MNIALWVVAGLLAAAFAAAGLMTLTQPKPKLAAAGMGWVAAVPAGGVGGIGALKVLAAVGLILPAALNIAPVLVPLAAVGLVLLMVGAAVTPARRSEASMIPVNLVLLALAVFVAVGRFGPEKFGS